MEPHEMTAISNYMHGKMLMTPSAALETMSAGFLDEIMCRQWILERLHPGGAICPGCSIKIEGEKQLQRFWSGERLKCRVCGKFFTAITGTLFAGCHLTFPEMFLMMLLLGTCFKDKFIAEKLKVSQESIRLWRSKFKHLSKGEPL